MRTLNQKGYKLITDFEGFSSKPYLCSAQRATIGFGNTYYTDGKKVTMNDKPITQAVAFWMFQKIADDFAKHVNSLLAKEVSQEQFNALVSICYNIGKTNFSKSTLLKLVNINPKDENIYKEFLKWNKANKKVLNGLTKRREAEAKHYFNK